MVRLGVRGITLQSGVVFVARGLINSKTEEDLVVNVDMLAKGLIWVQRLYLAFNKSHGTGGRSSSKVCVDIRNSSVSLHSLNEVLAGEVLHNLELFVPVVHLLGVDTIQRHNRLAEGVR